MKHMNMHKRVPVFLIGIFIMALGVAFSVKADLGVSPISCIPYVYSLKLDYTLGELTIFMNAFLVLGQILLLRRNYQLIQLVQLLTVTVFGFCIDFSVYLISGFNASNYVLQACWCLAGCVFLAFGVFLLVKANLSYLPGDGLAVVVADVFKKDFGKVKVSFDSSMVIIGLVSTFLFLGELRGIREGTVVAALLVGSMVKFFNSKLPIFDTWLGHEKAASVEDALSENSSHFPVVTIAREYGSGGHEIGQQIAKKLGFAFYDKELIHLTAEKGGFTEEYIKENEQKLANSLLSELYAQNYAFVDDRLPPLDALFLVQSKIIREVSSKGPCVIVGRCADFVLKDNPRAFNIFVHANEKYRIDKAINDYGEDSSFSAEELHESDEARARYCRNYTGRNWRDATNYHLTVDSSLNKTDKVAQEIIDILQDTVLQS